MSPMGQETTGQKYLPGDVCFKLWVKAKTLGVTAEILKQQGYVNPVKGTPPTRPGIETAAKMWLVSHPEEGREIFLEERRRMLEAGEGDLYAFAEDDTAYYSQILRYARSVLGRQKLLEFLDRFADRVSQTAEPALQ